MEKLERKDWKPEEQPILISLDLYHFIACTIGIDGKLEIGPSFYIHEDHCCVLLQCNYGFTHLTFAESNAAKISGIKYNVMQSIVWQDVMTDHTNESPEDVIARLNYAYRCRCNSNLIPSDDFVRQTKGTFVALGKLVAALCPSLDADTVSQAASKLADALRLRACPDTSAIVTSDYPSTVYQLPHSSHGNIDDSCMADKNIAMFRLYDIIEDCSIIYIKENDILVGRALVWRNVIDRRTNNSYTVMDRVYSDCAKTEAIFFQYARENGMLRKKKQSIDCNNWIDCKDSVLQNPDFVVNCGDLINAGLEKLPYLDSFYCYHDYEKVLSVDCTDNYQGHDNEDEADTYLRCTNGADDNGIICRGGVTCNHCNYDISDNDVIEHNDMIYCSDCFHELFFCCDHCDNVESIEDAVNIHTSSYEVQWCNDCASDHAYQCDHCESLYHSQYDLIETADEALICKWCRDTTTQCSNCGDVYYDGNKIIDGMCMDCHNNEQEDE